MVPAIIMCCGHVTKLEKFNTTLKVGIQYK